MLEESVSGQIVAGVNTPHPSTNSSDLQQSPSFDRGGEGAPLDDSQVRPLHQVATLPEAELMLSPTNTNTEYVSPMPMTSLHTQLSPDAHTVLEPILSPPSIETPPVSTPSLRTNRGRRIPLPAERIPEEPAPQSTSTRPARNAKNFNWRTRPNEQFYIGMHRRRQTLGAKVEFGFQMTVKRAIRKLGRTALESVVSEILQVGIEKRVFKPVNVKKLTVAQLRKIIRSSIFSKEKFFPDGAFEKLKSRLVAGGNMQDKSLYEDISSPTVATTSVLMVATIAAQEGRLVATCDVPGAYLNCNLSEDADPIHMRLGKLEAAILIQLDSSFASGMLEDGSCVVQLTKALYDLVESAKLVWHEHISGVLTSLGFTTNPYDPCVFNIIRNDVQCSIALHVDDLLITSMSDDNILHVHEALCQVYGEVALKRGPKLSYLGMKLDYSARRGVVGVRQE